jgi:hypothetical protein
VSDSHGSFVDASKAVALRSASRSICTCCAKCSESLLLEQHMLCCRVLRACNVLVRPKHGQLAVLYVVCWTVQDMGRARSACYTVISMISNSSESWLDIASGTVAGSRAGACRCGGRHHVGTFGKDRQCNWLRLGAGPVALLLWLGRVT